MKNQEELGKLKQKRRPQSLSNIEKGDYFTSGYNFYKNFMKRKKQLDGVGHPMERVGVYCVVYSMMEDRLETLWWNYSYCNQKKVLSDNTKEKKPRVIMDYEWKYKQIPPNIRKSGNFLRQLGPKEMRDDDGKVLFSRPDSWEVIDDELYLRILQSDTDRRELIHRNVFFTGDLKDKHINECVKIFRILDKMVQKHKRENYLIQG